MKDKKSAVRAGDSCAGSGDGNAADIGGELVIQRDQRGKLQAERRAGHRWSAKAEAVFLGQLEATCNVMASAAAAGFSTTAVYQRRRTYAAFGAAWAAALDTGYARLEMALVCAATNVLAPVPAPDGKGCAGAAADGTAGSAAPFGGMTAREALQVLRLHRYGARGGSPQRFDWRAKPVDPEATRAEILLKLDIIEGHDGKARGGGKAGGGKTCGEKARGAR